MLRFTTILLTALLFGQTTSSNDPLVEGELARLRACPDVFKTSPAPVFVRVVWRSPQNVAVTKDEAGLVRIEFVVPYGQSDFHESAEAASHATDFGELFALPQRNYYRREAGGFRLSYRESLIGKKWERQQGNAPELACWQTIQPSANPK
jgi:hypothetical protein